MSLIVIDASVAAKWVLAEPETAMANELLYSSARLAAPAINRIEVAGAVLRRYRSGVLTEGLARAACEKWERMVEDEIVHLVPTDDIYDPALDLAFRIKHALADCLYLAAAQRLDAPLVTADLTFRDRATKVYDRVEMLAKAA